MTAKTKRENKQGIEQTETWWDKWQAYVFIAVFALFVIWVYFSLLVTDMLFVKNLTEGHYPFIFFLLKDVIVYSTWGGLFLIAGLIVLIGSIYLLLAKKAAEPKKLIVPATFLTIIFLGLAYIFLGIEWINNIADSKDYLESGAVEKVIVLADYEVDYPSGMYGGAVDYVYKSMDGEVFKTNTNFDIEMFKEEKYEIYYLPRSKYIVGIDPIDN
ncbi:MULTISPECIES: hypothetical protein [Bacillaceae]|jgi:hypothetical protein|uniref:hypothetical protein n=1 Tax=Bacillaceae TaxID=186817 RepID=UPI0004E250D6|nr:MULTISPECIES: hypothetical protein [Bacillaceae]MCF2647840.1 hypothetical protein [Niallia circulans]MCM3362271.1 hypothetical protein [Niallia sp. MER TA 168]